jgi:hypothetical protein
MITTDANPATIPNDIFFHLFIIFSSPCPEGGYGA